jgi:hypothetical protein
VSFLEDLAKRFTTAVTEIISPGGERDGRILFWGEAKGQRPQDFVRHDIDESKRLTLAAILMRGNVSMAYMGYANCRICNVQLGTSDMELNGFTWPEQAGHYIIAHSVWTPGCDKLLAAVTRRSR